MLQLLTLALVLGVIFVNGWTDAPNAITTVVCAKVLPYQKAVWLAAGFDLLGILVMCLFSPAVTNTMLSMMCFPGVSSENSIKALCSAMAAIIVFSVIAWWFGVPTSESHGLIAAVAGSAAALGKFSSIDPDTWSKVLWGLVVSVALGFGMGWLCMKLFFRLFNRLKDVQVAAAQIMTAAATAFCHGAQDGQKFVAVFLAVQLQFNGNGDLQPARHPIILLLCAGTMALGTSLGGGRIIRSVGERMVAINPVSGLCADLATTGSLLMASIWGLPVSTTHTRTTAVMGAGLGESAGRVNGKVVGEMFAAWLITFPVCFAISFLLTRLVCCWP